MSSSLPTAIISTRFNSTHHLSIAFALREGEAPAEPKEENRG